LEWLKCGLSLRYSLPGRGLECYSCSMNKRSVKNKRSPKPVAKPSRKATSRKPSARAAAAQVSASRRSARKSPLISAVKVPSAKRIASSERSTVTVAQVTALTPSLHTHKFEVGQTVFYTSSPISRPGASGSYKVVRLLPSDGEDYQYRIKNPGEAFERVAKESQLEVEH
jgi:hypothetical protein